MSDSKFQTFRWRSNNKVLNKYVSKKESPFENFVVKHAKLKNYSTLFDKGNFRGKKILQWKPAKLRYGLHSLILFSHSSSYFFCNQSHSQKARGKFPEAMSFAPPLPIKISSLELQGREVLFAPLVHFISPPSPC